MADNVKKCVVCNDEFIPDKKSPSNIKRCPTCIESGLQIIRPPKPKVKKPRDLAKYGIAEDGTKACIACETRFTPPLSSPFTKRCPLCIQLNIRPKHESYFEKYNLNRDGTKVCVLCDAIFMPPKSHPYVNKCDPCRKNRATTVSSKSNILSTGCKVCGKTIRITKGMSSTCNEHSSPEEMEKRVNAADDEISTNLNYHQDMFDNLNHAMEDETEVYIDAIDKYRPQDLEMYPYSREMLIMLLLAKGFKLSKTGIPYKDYDNGAYMVSMTSGATNVGTFFFSIMEKKKNGRTMSHMMRTIADYDRIKSIVPASIADDIYNILELNTIKLAARRKDVQT